MGASVTALPNSKAKLQERLQAGRITWTSPRLGFLRFIPYSGIRWRDDYRAIELWWKSGTRNYDASTIVGSFVQYAGLAHNLGYSSRDNISRLFVAPAPGPLRTRMAGSVHCVHRVGDTP